MEAVDKDGQPIEVEEVRDPNYLESLRKIAKDTPRVIWHHPEKFTSYEDKIIAAGLMLRMPIYKICETIRCSRSALLNHIEKDEDLRTIREEAKGREIDLLEKGIDDLVDMRHPAILMWKAEKLLPQKYGKDRPAEEEDDTRIVLGVIPEEDLAEADRLLAEAAAKPPEVGLAALLDQQAMAKVENAVAGSPTGDGVPTLAEVDAAPAPPPSPQPAAPPEDETTTGYVDEFVDDFPSNDWMA